ncbi:MAG: VOC family protein [Micromonosporaceae bacterium]|jgi:catechol 2,3-dioxygenase-like lactoylglutathione lyase family enzyme|nr:VOC family protein [Micromonosporaceae bacterium]
MGVTRLNHAVLFVRDVARSVEFYTTVLDFEQAMQPPDGFTGVAFLKAPGSTNDHDLGLFQIGPGAASLPPAAHSPAGRSAVGLYHLAWEVDTLDTLERLAARLSEVGSLIGSADHGTTKSLYARDPDGLEFEVVWLVPADQLDDAAFAGRARPPAPLDLAKEKQRYGAQTRGGVGVSVPA